MENGFGKVSELGIKRINSYKTSQEIVFLTKPTGSAIYAHVNSTFPDNIRVRTSFRTGVFGSAQVIRQFGNDAFVEFAKDGDELEVFFPDGSVAKLRRASVKLEKVPLSIEDMMITPGNAMLAS